MVTQVRNTVSKFPSAFHCYKPPHFRVYGCICVSPENRVALVQGPSGIWSFPKGHLERCETSKECAHREFFEETGKILDDNAAFVNYKKLANGGYYIYNVPCEFSIQPLNRCEIQRGGWFTLEEMAAMDCNVDVNFYKNFLQKKKL